MMKGSLLVVAVLIAVTACNNKATPTLTPMPTRLTALLFGELVEVEGCPSREGARRWYQLSACLGA